MCGALLVVIPALALDQRIDIRGVVVKIHDNTMPVMLLLWWAVVVVRNDLHLTSELRGVVQYRIFLEYVHHLSNSLMASSACFSMRPSSLLWCKKAPSVTRRLIAFCSMVFCSVVKYSS